MHEDWDWGSSFLAQFADFSLARANDDLAGPQCRGCMEANRSAKKGKTKFPKTGMFVMATMM